MPSQLVTVSTVPWCPTHQADSLICVMCCPYGHLCLQLLFQTHKEEEKHCPNCPLICKPVSLSVDLVLHMITGIMLTFSLNPLPPFK